MIILGVDFTSRPTRTKPITIARGRLSAAVLELDVLHACDSFDAFSALLAAPGPWVGAFDFPFSLPRVLVRHLGWPDRWDALIDFYASLSRAQIRETFKAFCDARPAGSKFAHRACDLPARASPSMKWVNPPVAWMLHAGAPLLKRAGVCMPVVRENGDSRIALEGYPGYLARRLIGNVSYKSDDRRKQTMQRRAARRELVARLEGAPLGIGAVPGPDLALTSSLRRQCVADASGDSLDAVLCAVAAAWGAGQARSGYGLPATVDPLEGWIVGVPPPD